MEVPYASRARAGAGVVAALVGELVPEQFDGLPERLVDQPAGSCLIQGDGPDTGAPLRRPAVQLPWQRDELPGDGQLAGLGVEVVAVQRGGLAAAQAAQRQPPQRASRSFSTPVRKLTSCRSVQTATGGRMPSRRRASTRSSVQMTGCGRTGLSSRTWASGLAAMRPSRMAAFSADRSVARTRSTVDAAIGVPFLCAGVIAG